MNYYNNLVLPMLLDYSCGKKHLQEDRSKIIPMARGRVLEIGIGSGLNLPFYDPDKIDHLIGVDLCHRMLARASRRASDVGFTVDLRQLGVENLPLDTNSVDTVVSTFTLCTIPLIPLAIAEIHRVLKPDGFLIFCEHGKAPDVEVQRWQDRLNPLWKKAIGGCNLNRDIPHLLREGRFYISKLTTSYKPGSPRFAGYFYSGVAVPIC